MPKHKALFFLALVILFVSGTISCGPGDTRTVGGGTSLYSIEINPADNAIGVGMTVQFAANGTYTDGTTADFTALVTWSSSDETVATVDTGGRVTGHAVGITEITAVYSGGGGSAASLGFTRTGKTSLTVVPKTVDHIKVEPPNPSVAKGLPQQFTATATYSDLTTGDITDLVTWTSSDTGVATISNTVGSQGLASTLAEGTTTISAGEPVSGIILSSYATFEYATLTVTAADLVSIAITPPNPSVALGLTPQFTATGIYTDSTNHDITDLVTWSSSDTSVATISNTVGSQGLADTLAVGTTTVSAVDPATGISSADTNENAVLTVTAAVLASISVTPTNPSVAKGVSQQFTATGIYTDSSTQDLTTQVTWYSTVPGVGTVSNLGGSEGLASTLAVGITTVYAVDSATGISSTDSGGDSTLTVTAAGLVSIAITPVNPSLALGLTQQFAATGTYTDSSTQDITTQVTWYSTVPGVATVSNAGGSEGLASTLAVGTTTVYAVDPATGISSTDSGGDAALTVTAAELAYIDVTPANPSLALGLTQQFTATGTYTDSSTQDLTTQVTWYSTVPGVATVSNAGGSEGLATTLAVGTTTVYAVEPVSGVSSEDSGGSALLTVTPAALVSIAITPATPPSLAAGLTEQFAATGTYTDSSTMDITTQVTWYSTVPGVATVSNAGGSEGLATTLAAGTTTVYAIDSATGISSTDSGGDATLTVTAAALLSIAITPSSPTVGLGGTRQFTAMGTYTDSSTQDITTQVTWYSTDTGVATVSNAGGSQGLVSGIVEGTASIWVFDPATFITSTATGGDAVVTVVVYASEGTPASPVDITGFTPYDGMVGTGYSYYIISVTPGNAYLVTLTNLDDDADLYLDNDFDHVTVVCSSITPGTAVEYCAYFIPIGITELHILVDGGKTAVGAGFTITVSP